jgi:alkylation response protein AidB-like acyl-CoA dehydrogenase
VHESPERHALRKTAAALAAAEIAPRVERADREHDGHLPPDEHRAVVAAAAGAGLLSLLLPEEHGGGGGTVGDLVVAVEELGAADAGTAAGLALTATVPTLVVVAGTPDQRERWLGWLARAQAPVLGGALNEPGRAGSDLFDPGPGTALTTRAVRDGEEYVLTGSKAQWVTNAGIADAYIVFARTGDGPPATSTTAFWVPADARGLSVGTRSDLLGLRSGFHAELHLDGVRVPAHDRIGDEGAALGLLAVATPAMPVGLAAVFVGVARAAHELALDRASTRTSWGRPLREHQAVALQLADGAVELRQARLLVAEAAEAIDTGADPAELALLVPAAKERAVRTAIANAERAVRILGAEGVTRGSGAEKLLRDAWTGWSCDFTGDLLRLGIAAGL